ncbi:MAG: MBL fold metallo-hydrolase [Acidobacteriota bacterium]|nr:MBL fold metallo-hydrolase [Blastocatellia bacterium]MDW8238626.1 MBL fold metallo-hydrolase [Acidobacteriota bacterium]
MIFKQLNAGPCRTYLIASAKTREAVLVDPLLDHVGDYLRMLEQEQWQPVCIIDTHTHADHLSGGAALLDHLNVPYVMHASAKPQCVTERLTDGDTIQVGDLSILCRHTPGHTSDSMTLVVADKLLTGDFLFIGEGGAGRTDLPSGDPGEHFDSLQKLKEFADHFLVFPAHDYHGHTYSTLGQERRTNPRLQFTSREQYVYWLSNLALPPVEWMKDVLNANYACTRDPNAVWIPRDLPACEVKGTISEVEADCPVMTISPEQAHHMLQSGGDTIVVLDVRTEEEYGGELGHIQGAYLLPVQELACRLHELEPYRDKCILTVCRSGVRSAKAARILMQAGFTNVQSVAGGMLEWNRQGYPVNYGEY